MFKRVAILFFMITTILYSQTGAQYLIITHDNFYNAILPLAQWKHKKGLATRIVTLSEIGATAESISRIKNYIVSAYNNWTPRPEYVLLVGAPEYLRAEQNQFDDYYGNTMGNYLMELSVGRFSCRTVSECSLLVYKTLSYERYPYLTDTFWYLKATGIVREDYSASDSVYWQDLRYIYDLWLTSGYRHIDSFSRANGNSGQDVENAITEGRAFVVFRGQGVNNWWSPFAINPESTHNGYKLPIIVSGTCATLSLEPNVAYLGERAVRAGSTVEPKGAVAFLGTTNSASGTNLSIMRGIVTKRFFNAIYTENITKLGDALRRSKFILDSLRPSGYNSTRYREWNLLGDPELNIWTDVPRSLIANYDSVIPLGTQNLLVEVSSNGAPISNALVCIYQPNLIYQSGFTDSLGRVVFTVTPTVPGTVSLTVTKHNFCPYEGYIRVVASGLLDNTTKARNTSYPKHANPIKNAVKFCGNYSQVVIYDILGRKVKTIQLNRNTTSIDISGLMAGVYLVSFIGHEQNYYTKLVKIK
ncbi:MAG: C25 family cysteine peptidase [candidate division WOR-3 bacterium]